MASSDIFRAYDDKRILITGGAGCIGSNLTRKLLELNPELVIVLDDLSASFRWNLPEDKRVAFVQGSILDDEKLGKVFGHEPHYVFHLAAHFANQNSMDHPETDLMVNGLGTLKLLQHAATGDTRKFVYASSGCSVYGHSAPLPLTEDYVSLHLDTPYQIHKLLGELYCSLFRETYGLPITVARFFNVYGPGEVPGRYRNVIPNFMWWALHNKPLPITGTGQETRDFTYVEDIVDGTLRMGVIPEAVGEAINLASETETRIVDLAHTINEIVGNGAGVIFKDKRRWDRIMRRRASIQKARGILSYEPKYDIHSGLKEAFRWMMENAEGITASVEF